VITIAAKRRYLAKVSHVGRSCGRPPFEGSSDSRPGPSSDSSRSLDGAAHESAFGTKRTFLDSVPMSAFGGKADTSDRIYESSTRACVRARHGVLLGCNDYISSSKF
jgi:hypothetical protein